jgi:hypothetical protein
LAFIDIGSAAASDAPPARSGSDARRIRDEVEIRFSDRQYRGQVQSLDGKAIVIASQEFGKSVTVAISTDTKTEFLKLAKATLDDLAVGTYVSVTCDKGPSGELAARTIELRK